MSNNKTKFNIGIILTVTIISTVFAAAAVPSLTTYAYSQSNLTTTSAAGGGDLTANSTTSSLDNATSGLLTNSTFGSNSTSSDSNSK